MNEGYILQVSQLNKAFWGVVAVFNVSFELKKGDFLGIIGPNGSGKSTLLNLITGFVRPDSGSILYCGREISAKKPHSIANLGIARTFQMAKAFYRMPA